MKNEIEINGEMWIKKDSLPINNPVELGFKVGEKYFIRTVTSYYTGVVIAVNDREVKLDNACWIANTGRFYDALKDGVFKEVEPFPMGTFPTVQINAMCEYSVWLHDLPVNQK